MYFHYTEPRLTREIITRQYFPTILLQPLLCKIIESLNETNEACILVNK